MSDFEFLIDPQKDYYKVLRVKETAILHTIKKAYKRLAIKCHPDKSSGNEKKMKEINEAYDVLKNKEKRTYYDNLREEYFAETEWKFSKKKAKRKRKKRRSKFFDNAANKQLKDFIFDSLLIFQDQLGLKITKKVQNDFKAAVEFVYDTWNELKETERIDYYTFGGIRAKKVHKEEF